VRNLAQKSATAAKEIKQLINNSVDKVHLGSDLVEKAGNTMSEVVKSVQKVTDIMDEITAASQEQASGIEQVNHAVIQMDQVTQQNAALVEEASAASKAMQNEAANLAQVVNAFKVNRVRNEVFSKTKNRIPKLTATAQLPNHEKIGKKVAVVNGNWEEF
jgi:methyl-accepting chemotaxis protein